VGLSAMVGAGKPAMMSKVRPDATVYSGCLFACSPQAWDSASWDPTKVK
jgi:hypothetical protein